MRAAQIGLHFCRILLTATLALATGCSSKHELVDNPSDAPSCGADELACSGSCVRASSDPLHGGQCGNACAAGSLCCSGACVSTASCSFAVTRAVPASGWLNGGGYVKLEGAGFVRGITVSIAGAATPARVINANSILVQTPPGPIGPQDITIRAGGMSATLARGGQLPSGSVLFLSYGTIV